MDIYYIKHITEQIIEAIILQVKTKTLLVTDLYKNYLHILKIIEDALYFKNPKLRLSSIENDSLLQVIGMVHNSLS